MSEYEKIDCRITPSHWDNTHLILPKSIGKCNTVYPYCFSRTGMQSHLLLYTVSGEGQLEYNGGVYPLLRGDLFFIDCFQPQTYKAIGDHWDFVFVHTMDVSLTAPYYNAITQGGKHPIFHYTPFIKDCWEKLYRAAAENQPESPARASLCLVSLFLNLLEISKQSVPPDIENTAAYMKAHYNEKISLYALADMAHLSKYHFIRRFQQFYNVTPHEYLQLCRIDQAKSRLLCTNDSIEDIATLCGYTSSSAFCQNFKNHNGISPSVFRRQMRII